jgi:hypothetical protein
MLQVRSCARVLVKEAHSRHHLAGLPGAGAPTRTRELISFARQHGYGPSELIRLIRTLG